MKTYTRLSRRSTNLAGVAVDTIHNEDCATGMARLPDNCIDLVFTSPPYDGIRLFKGNFDFGATAAELFRITKPGGCVVWNVFDQVLRGKGYSQTSHKQALFFTSLGFHEHLTIIWYKGFGRYASRNRYRPDYENIFVFSKGRPKTVNRLRDRPNKTAGKMSKSPDERRPDGRIIRRDKRFVTEPYGYRSCVWHIPPETGGAIKDSEHSARFPVALAFDVVRSFSRVGDIVLDPFMGSGTTAIGAMRCARRFVGFEIDKKYWREASRRIERERLS